MSATHSKKERLMLYRRGWKNGAAGQAQALVDTDYLDGYYEGDRARRVMDADALGRFGISSEEAASWVLRTTPPRALEHREDDDAG